MPRGCESHLPSYMRPSGARGRKKSFANIAFGQFCIAWRSFMANTYTELLFHIVFSTRNRAPIIYPAWRNRLYEYTGGIVRFLGGYSEQIGGTIDHIHIFVRLKPIHNLADLVCRIKKSSSQWIHDELGFPQFHWQEGYGGFTVSPSDAARVRSYIAHQEEHHRTKSFQEEYV